MRLAHLAGPGDVPRSGDARHLGCGSPPRLVTCHAVAGGTNPLEGGSPGNRLSRGQAASHGERCPRGRYQGLQRNRHRRSCTDGLYEAVQLGALTFVLPSEHAVPAFAFGRPDGDPLEVVQPPVAGVTSDVQCFFRET